MPAFERVKESHFCVWGPKRLSLAFAVKAVSGGEGEGGWREREEDDLVSASWGFDPQTVSGGEIVGERMPERMSLRLD
jgi:hypothetical protein